MNDSKELLEANQTFYRAFEKRNLDAMSAVWSQGAGCMCVHPGRKALQGWQAIRSSWEEIFKNTSYIEIETDIVSAEAAGNLGYIVLVENLLQVIHGSRLEAQSMATNIFELMGGKWYLIHHHGSPVVR
ncbi:MAG: nuclear transport factor 2 family protein [Coleofasciculaceae cyanobacterium SM2_3_26]|nr:nuclear transport factor 2 family protein [Coleofasciculaceae cyanobacterium SM2_3_26]